MLMDKLKFANKIKNSIYWWLGFRHDFYVNDEYKIELLHIDRINNSVKIRVTNLKTNEHVVDGTIPEIGNER